jgi:hypothetical protein
MHWFWDHQVTETMLKVLTCRSVDGKRILQFYPGVECADSQHLPLLIVSAILLFLFVIGVPTFMVLYYKQCVNPRLLLPWNRGYHRCFDACVAQVCSHPSVQQQSVEGTCGELRAGQHPEGVTWLHTHDGSDVSVTLTHSQNTLEKSRLFFSC